ncbi:hypothetical protein Asch01_00695 [Acinetobacter schindleri]|uniref:TetR/AcrR family transcriptional regulator n=1 Tax=Acinetobacter schindleri TaxID=108981 RepID=UPI0030ACE922
MQLPVLLEDLNFKLNTHIETFDWEGLTKSKLLILKAFLRLSTSEGYAAVTMRSIAKMVDLKPSTIYSHYPEGKEEIVSSALRWHYHTFALSVKEGFKNCESPEQFWESLIRVHITEQIKRPENDLWDTLMAMDRLGSILQPELRDEMHTWMVFCDYMYEAIAMSLGYQNVNQKAKQIRVLLDGANSWWSWDGTDESLSKCIDEALNIANGMLKI